MTTSDTEAIADAIVAAVRAAVAPYEKRIAELEARGSGVQYAGIFQLGKTYPRGSLCTRDGSLWLALDDTTLQPGANPGSWRLIVKEGHAR